jgi:hypothetical protein
LRAASITVGAGAAGSVLTLPANGPSGKEDTMTMRRTAGALLIAALALTGAACSSDSKSDSADSKKTTTTAVTSTTAKPLSDEEYSAAINEATAKVQAAGTDLCAVTAASSDAPAVPSSTAQVQATVDYFVTLMNAVAGALPAENAASADAFRGAATAVKDAAETAGYPADFFESEAASSALSGTAYQEATNEFQTIYTSTCAAAASSTTTAPAG